MKRSWPSSSSLPPKKGKPRKWFKPTNMHCNLCKMEFTVEKRHQFVMQPPAPVDLVKEFDLTETGILNHYRDCYRPRKLEFARCDALFVECQDLNFSGSLRVVFALKTDATLGDLNEAIRCVWFRPCGCENPRQIPHPCQFWVMDDKVCPELGKNYGMEHPKVSHDALNVGSLNGKSREDDITYGMDELLINVMLKPTQMTVLQYDVGCRATSIGIVSRQVKPVNFRFHGKPWKSVARNTPLKIPCAVSDCEEIAEWIVRDYCTESKNNNCTLTFVPERFFCSVECARKHGPLNFMSKDMLPLVNSPRMGCCSYEGGEGSSPQTSSESD